VADGYGCTVRKQSTWEVLPRGILAVAPLAGSLAVTDALCRLACNLGAGAGRGPGPTPQLPSPCAHSVRRCTCTHSPHSPPWPGHSFPDCVLIVCRCTRTHSPHPPPWPYNRTSVRP